MKKNLLFSTAIIASLAIGCNDTIENPIDSIVENIVNYKGTQSPGDVWEWSINYDQNTMTASWDYGTFDDTSDDVHIEGSVENFESGFLKVTITSVEPENHPDIPADGTAWFYALELPDMALVIKPEGSIKGDLIAMVAQGDASTMAGSYNYILTAPGNGQDFNPTVEEALGQVEIASNGLDGFDITGTAMSLDCFNGGDCSYNSSIGGVPSIEVLEGGEFMIYDENSSTVASGQYTNAGIMMIDFGFGNGGVFALQQNNVAISDLNNATFNGLAYLPANDGEILPVNLSFDANGLVTGNQYTDIENNILSEEDAVQFEILNIENGLVSGFINHNDGTDTPLAGAVKVQGDKKILVLSSTTSEEGNPPLILVLTSK